MYTQARVVRIAVAYLEDVMTDSKAQKPKREMGEGDRESARRYNERTRRFIEGADVEEAARDAEPRSEAERRELGEAERRGRARAREHDHSETFDPSRAR